MLTPTICGKALAILITPRSFPRELAEGSSGEMERRRGQIKIHVRKRPEQRERRDQGPDQRIAIGARHGAEYLTLDALHGEQGNERGYDDGRGEEHRPIYLQRADQDQPQAVVPDPRSVS